MASLEVISQGLHSQISMNSLLQAILKDFVTNGQTDGHICQGPPPEFFFDPCYKTIYNKFQRKTYPNQWSQNMTFSSRSLPMNTVVLFVPQQEAWIVERFGKFDRILNPVSV